MTVMESINMADELKPNAFTQNVKLGWLNDCEGLVQTEVFLLEPDICIRYGADDMNVKLLAVPPHDKLYWTYLSAMIDFGLGEYSKYQNTMELFNTYFGEYQRWYARRFKPADRGNENAQFFAMVRGTTPILEFTELPVTGDEVTACTVTITQGGAETLKFELEDIDYTDDTLTCPISREDSLKLKAGLGEVRIKIQAGDQYYETLPLTRVMVYE